MSLSYVLFSVIYLFQRLDDKLRILNEAKESYMKARNEFAAKVGIIVLCVHHEETTEFKYKSV